MRDEESDQNNQPQPTMAFNTKPPDFEEMDIYKLNQALEKQLFLLNKIGDRLPDSGKKLEKSIARLKFLISKAERRLPPSQLSALQPNLVSRPSQCHSQKLLTVRGEERFSKSTSAGCTTTESEVDSLVSTLELLNLKPENPALLLDSEDCLDEVPRLSAEEVLAWRRACNLPTWPQEHGFRWFTFRLRRLGNALVSLTVLDCQRPDRVFTRVGALSTWPILREGPQCKFKSISDRFDASKSLNLSPTKTVTVGEAVSDLWCFLKDLSSGDRQQRGHPVLLCAPPSTTEHKSDTVGKDDFVRFRRLFFAARHCPSARSSMPRDLLMAVTSNKYEEVPSSASQDEEDPLVAEEEACLALKEHIFDAVKPGEVETLRPGGFSALEFFSANQPRTCAWLEAPLHLFVLRKIAVPPDQVDSNPPFVPKAAFSPDVNAPKPLYPVSPTVHPLDVEDVVLRRLAAAGFCSSSLAFLAGTGGWRGFAGLLSAPAVCGFPNDIESGGHHDSGPTQPLVSSDQRLLCRLYAHFRRVYKGLVLNASHYAEADHRVKSSSTCMKIPPGDIKWAPGSAVSVLGWIDAPAGLAPRKIKTLSIQESINLMDRVRQDYLASWKKFNLPALPKLPPQPALSLKYRETDFLDDDDDAKTLSADESDCETVIDG